jgi:hypothetical protein
MSSQARAINTNVVNGIDTDQVKNLAGKIAEDEDYGRFQWRAANRWIDGAKSRTSIQGFFAGKEENTERKQVLTVDADQPEFLAGGIHTARIDQLSDRYADISRRSAGHRTRSD